MPSLSAAEQQVRFFSPMPKDYQFVPKGDVYVTSNVRKRTHAAGATLYVVVDKLKRPLGVRCPTSIYQEVTAAAQATAASRAAMVQNRDIAVERGFEAEVLRQFLKVPRADLANILKQALQKRSRRVGRTGTLDMESKVQLAVKAYIRHCHTPYEHLLKGGTDRGKARQMVLNRLKQVACSWTGNTKETMADMPVQQAKGKRKAGTGQSDPRKRKATTLPSRSTVQPASGPADSDNEEISGGECDSDALSFIGGDESADSDWTP